jgi:hypothetical protein
MQLVTETTRCSNCGSECQTLIRFEHGRPVCLACVELARDMLMGESRPPNEWDAWLNTLLEWDALRRKEHDAMKWKSPGC